jgi:hypothetical protein
MRYRRPEIHAPAGAMHRHAIEDGQACHVLVAACLMSPDVPAQDGKMSPDVPPCPRMSPKTRRRKTNPPREPRRRSDDAGLPQLTPVDVGLPRRSIRQNEPTAAHHGTFRHINDRARHATWCNGMQRHATGFAIWQNEPTVRSGARSAGFGVRWTSPRPVGALGQLF